MAKEINILDDKIALEKDKNILNNLIAERSEFSIQQDKYYQNEAKGAQIRSRAKWLEQGEKNTKYFLNLENKHQSNNKINCITSNDGNKYYKSSDILKEGSKFYRTLYKERKVEGTSIDLFLNNIDLKHKLSHDESSLCEGLITEKECFDAVMHMAKNKSPGYDGLLPEFYQIFWNDIKKLLIESFNESFTQGELSELQKQIIMCLLFKKGDRSLFKNYRPISLSNCDYKILAFVLANRLHKVIDRIISPEQVAYIKNRYIGQNVRLLLDVMEYIKRENKEGVVLFLDFEKAFDSLNWMFIDSCLKKMGFGPDFCKWLKIIYTKPKAFLKINGFLSEGINLERGARQGCPLSCLIFIICTEFMTLALQQSNKIKGIELKTPENTKEIRITQYADDTCLFLKNLNQIQNSLDIIKSFSSVSGLTLNITKTEGLTLGTLPNNPGGYDYIKWPQGPIRYLGIYLGHNVLENNEMNWVSKIKELQKLIDSWRKRKLTIFGKILIIKTLALPKLIYPASLLPLPQDIIKNVNTIFFKYIWGKTEKIKRNVLTSDYCKGGLKMIDIESQFSALKALWMSRIQKDSNLIWAFLPKHYIMKCTSNMVLNMNFTDKKQFPRLKMIPDFYQEVISAYCKSNNPQPIDTKTNLYNQIIWGNRFFQVNHTSLFSKAFIDAGYIYIKDILDENGKLKANIYETLNCKRHYLRTTSLIQYSLRPYKQIRFSEEGIYDETVEKDVSGKTSKYYYKGIMKNKGSNTAMIRGWCTKFDSEIDWLQVYKRKIKNQFEMKISEFNFKLQHNILPTKCNLFKWKICGEKRCIYCAHNEHNTKHLFFDCPSLGNIWQIISDICDIVITWEVIIIGHQNICINKIVSLFCYIVYKKYLCDKENITQTTLADFLDKDVKFRIQEYPLSICDLQTKNLISRITQQIMLDWKH